MGLPDKCRRPAILPLAVHFSQNAVFTPAPACSLPLYAGKAVLYIRFVGLVEGIPALVFGIALIFFAQRLASLQREWSWGSSRWSRYYGKFRLWPGIFDSDRGILVLTFFWRVCGACWVIGASHWQLDLPRPFSFQFEPRSLLGSDMGPSRVAIGPVRFRRTFR